MFFLWCYLNNNIIFVHVYDISFSRFIVIFQIQASTTVCVFADELTAGNLFDVYRTSELSFKLCLTSVEFFFFFLYKTAEHHLYACDSAHFILSLSIACQSLTQAMEHWEVKVCLLIHCIFKWLCNHTLKDLSYWHFVHNMHNMQVSDSLQEGTCIQDWSLLGF